MTSQDAGLLAGEARTLEVPLHRVQPLLQGRRARLLPRRRRRSAACTRTTDRLA
jgi:hypothetical protein